jgi:hypothetical protein
MNALPLLPANLPSKIKHELQLQYHRIQPFVSAARLWERVLHVRERQRLGDTVQHAYAAHGTVGMWQKVRGGSDARGVIEVARALGFIDQTNYEWLVREIGERPKAIKQSLNKPTWDVRSGELCFQGQVIRKVRLMRRPSNIHRILDAFQTAKWKTQIANTLSLDQQRLHQALRSLNTGLNSIGFHSARGGQVISWKTL